MNNSIIKLIITLATFSSISFVDSDSIDKRSPSTEGVIIGPDTPVYYVECPLNDCLVLNKSVNKFEASPSYYYYRDPEHNFNDTFFPKILVVLDWDNGIENGEQRILNDVLTKWNAADKYFEQLGDPKIKLAIAGVIIATQSDIWRTTDPSKRPELSNMYSAHSVLNNMTKWLIDNSDHFKSLNYDVYMFISRWKLARTADAKNTYVNYENGRFNCDTKIGSDYRPLGALVHKDFSNSRYVYGISVMLNIPSDEPSSCGAGHIMSVTRYSLKPTWSKCSKQAYKSIIEDSKYSCLHQIPYGQYEDDYTFFRKND